MKLCITPGKLRGIVEIPSSKSMAHRYLLCAALAACGGALDSVVSNLSFSEDIAATIRAVEALGALCEIEGRTVRVKKGKTAAPLGAPVGLDCGESGSTLRFLIPVALALQDGAPVRFTGHGRLMERPLEPYSKLFAQKGISFYKERDTLFAEGRLPAGTYELSGQVSSQFVTGLLLALSTLKEPSEIVITDGLQSKGYVDMTLCAMEAFGIKVENQSYERFLLPGGQAYKASICRVEGDYSQAAFFLGAAFLGSEVQVNGLNPSSLQGDRAVCEILEAFQKPGNIRVDGGEIPDLIPLLSVCAAGRKGEVLFENVSRLRLKESDRLETTAALLRGLGGAVLVGADFLLVKGTGELPGGGTVNSENDHRIAMAAAIAAGICKAPFTLEGAQSVSKSYPDFWGDFKALGGVAAGE